MNYAEEQLQNVMENELQAIKDRNKELVTENKQLEKECIDLANEKDDLEIENRKLTNEIEQLKANLDYERNMYSSLKDTCKGLEFKLREEVLKSKRIVKDLVDYL